MRRFKITKERSKMVWCVRFRCTVLYDTRNEDIKNNTAMYMENGGTYYISYDAAQKLWHWSYLIANNLLRFIFHYHYLICGVCVLTIHSNYVLFILSSYNIMPIIDARGFNTKK